MKKTFNLFRRLIAVMKPNIPSKENRLSNHQPSWMYKNE